jgi:hypothetical protein
MTIFVPMKKNGWIFLFIQRINYVHAEHTSGILGTLATIYCQRGTLEEHEEVLDMEDKVHHSC